MAEGMDPLVHEKLIVYCQSHCWIIHPKSIHSVSHVLTDSYHEVMVEWLTVGLDSVWNILTGKQRRIIFRTEITTPNMVYLIL